MSQTYLVIDRVAQFERIKLGSNSTSSRPNDIRAVATGENRPPKAGEWYLSGAQIEAYRAIHDFTEPCRIARLVRVTVETTVRIVQE
jgi:hypothetical protein